MSSGVREFKLFLGFHTNAQTLFPELSIFGYQTLGWILCHQFESINHPISQIKEMLRFLNHPSNLQPAKSSAKFLRNMKRARLRMNILTPPAPGRFPWSGFPALIWQTAQAMNASPAYQLCVDYNLQGRKYILAGKFSFTTHFVFLSTF